MTLARCGVLALAAALSLPATAQTAGDAQAGRDKSDTCMGCHGIPGYNNAYPTYRVPKLGGQSAGYIASALKAYRSGERAHPTMQAQAASMSDQDIADIAAFLATAPAHRSETK
ncbi:MAG TPA: c-type cytochrome [Nevskiaceae bacterium]|nr:c-type cytochrome [Nevskiaceae bacterium]